jgi:hypothetical protein
VFRARRFVIGPPPTMTEMKEIIGWKHQNEPIPDGHWAWEFFGVERAA